MILVIGATGTIGTALVRCLANYEEPVRALVRPRRQRSSYPNQHGVQPQQSRIESSQIHYMEGEVMDLATLQHAMRGVEKIFLSMGNGPMQREIELSVVREAAKANIEHFVKVSAPIVGPHVPIDIGRLHFEIEESIIATGMSHTFLRPYGFMQNLLQQAHVIGTTGTFFGSTGHAKMNLVDARDVAEVGALALANCQTMQGTFVLTGPQTISYPEIAHQMSQTLGYRVTYINQTPQRFRSGLEANKLPAWLIEHLMQIQKSVVEQEELPNSIFEQLMGSSPRTLDAFLKEHKSAFLHREPRYI
ncbi:MAG: NmrA family NAD(P)-binding protein, partial [Myxococcota bacterium]